MAECIRQRYEEAEKHILSPLACLSSQTRGRQRPESLCEIRTEFSRDRDRIIHCKSFRRLKHKTQVFLSPEGDHYRTRLTHTLEVSQIARTIARALRLNEDLTEAVAMGHDLGHTPFGHAGERTLDKICSLGFKHYEQSLRVVDVLERNRQGLNLTFEVRDGILCHTRGEPAATLEGQIVRTADRIAYINHDIDDAVRGGILKESDIPADIRKVLGAGHSERIDTLIRSVTEYSEGKNFVSPGGEVKEAFDRLHDFMFDSVYLGSRAKSEEKKAQTMLEFIYVYYLKNTGELPEDYKAHLEEDGGERVVCDFVSGMSDGYAIKVFENLFIPKTWNI